jgi:putative NADPH-quinone reductase
MKITVIQGHPDDAERHYCHALAAAYLDGATAGGHQTRLVDAGAIDFPLLRSPDDFATGTPTPDIAAAQETIAWADHIVFVFPLWLGTMPALLKAFLEQVFRPTFLGWKQEGHPEWKRPRKSRRSARLIVTMGMPALVYRWFYGASGIRGMERNILRFCGFGKVRHTFIGMAGGSESSRESWLRRIELLGRNGK